MTATNTQVTTRKRSFSFGPVWSAAVVAGKVSNRETLAHEKLIAHAVKLKIGSRSNIKRLKFDTLLAKVAAALTSVNETPAAE